MWETWVRSLGWEDSLEKGKATHSSIWPGEFRTIQSMASQRVGHDWATFHSLTLLVYHSLLNSCYLASVDPPLHWNQGCQGPSWSLSGQIQCTSCFPSFFEDWMVWPTAPFSEPSFLLAFVALPLPGLSWPFQFLLIDLLPAPGCCFPWLYLEFLHCLLHLFAWAISTLHSFNLQLYPNLCVWPKHILWSSDPWL